MKEQNEPFKLAYQFEDELTTCEMIAETMCEIAGIDKKKWKEYYKIIYNIESNCYELYLRNEKGVDWNDAIRACLH